MLLVYTYIPDSLTASLAVNFNDLGQFGQSIDDGSPSITKFRLEDEDAELNEIGSLLPDDEDELLAGIMEDFDLSELPSQVEDLEEDDLFGSGGGMELDFDNNLSKLSLFDGVNGNGGMNYGLPNGVGTVAGEHPYGEHPSRTLFVRNINSNVEDSELRALFEVFSPYSEPILLRVAVTLLAPSPILVPPFHVFLFWFLLSTVIRSVCFILHVIVPFY